jgi:hypothetical protein|tara:strand:+ start:5999 stop:6574 length:576 start_codon:yes stop_codon:yes gene_type:complete
MINENLEKLVQLARDKKASAFKSTFTSEVNSRLTTKVADMKEKLSKTMFAKKEALSEAPKDVEHTHGDVTHSHDGGDKEHTHDNVEHSHGDVAHSHEAGDAEHTHEGTLPPALQKAIDAKKKKAGKDDDDDKEEAFVPKGMKIPEGSKEAYQKFFNKKLAKYKVKSPSSLSDEDKKKFFGEIEKEWKSEDE